MKLKNFIIFLVCALFFSCVEEEQFDNSAKGNFEALWKVLDERYCFFDYKKEVIGLDWNEVHDKYAVRINNNMTNAQLFEVLCDMLSELQDGHVNLYAAHDVGRNWSWYENYPANFSSDVQKKYLGNDYMIASGIKYKILDDNIGYIFIESFSDGIGDGNLSQVLSDLAICNGVIVDVRDNGGGNITTSQKVANRFCNEKKLVGYICHKTGKGHSDFSELKPMYLEPSDGVRWQKKAVVLTNRQCYSATNSFVNEMRYCPNVTIVGDKTGGGSGLPFSSELPKGWSIRFSACPMFDAEKKQIEFGIEPDIYVDMRSEDALRGIDTLIEYARNMLGGK